MDKKKEKMQRNRRFHLFVFFKWMMTEILNIHASDISFKADIWLSKIFKRIISCHNIAKLAADA